MWKAIRGLRGRYSINERGQVYSHISNKILAHRNTERYPTVALWLNNTQKNYYVHQLVARYFIGSKPTRYQVHHKNGVKRDCRVTNLRYLTRSAHYRESKKLGQTMFGEKNGNCRISTKQAKEIFMRAHLGENQRLLSIEFGVSQPHIARIKSGLVWACISKDMKERGVF